ncbi:centrosomal protein of 44 kDa [Heteronotia binoei]|uniref:centrosomal protein of 44 kDa n=1 Tax=Heteronotia binoei TaxID=13085 RepID=UPI00292FC225|nr:centrosomal protein of 44 kDa [Heteronotia binoei]XP_060102505.1 centrosomal protein of 44 kDa [Heteronotia binoei]XP_060102506.1 centrosomal protein of 44 kDa [Heteronotia binoei]XP_060102507.1 centrosomal protein of 44 kDa [Heteronotia binoei]XP_060102508.1 centrosomal protein of 44 kDa [Heteronotia binoei]XP_060102509.1 centrosomal protein of 44 kDa [Heteronotia binoei]XP_060102511.1 centrosomal protein of 44 kDa [Heteronotia binoei]
MATGDLKGNLRRIEQGLRLLNYSKDVDYTGLAKGDPSAFLPIISYCFTSFSTHIVELLVELDVELTAKNDLRFIEATYKLLRDHFQYKPVLTKHQFLQYGFAERKIQIVCEIISLVYKKHKELSNIKVKSQTRKKIHAVKYEPQASSHLDSVCDDVLNFQQKPQIERHVSKCNIYSPEDVVRKILVEEADTSYNAHEEREVTCAEEPCLNQSQCLWIESTENKDQIKCDEKPLFKDNDDQMKELKSQFAELQEKVNKLNWIEEKLVVLEEKLQGKVIIDERDWNNLLSRILLLETQLLLKPEKINLSTEFNNMNEENASGIHMTPVSPDKEKEELPESLHQSSGYSSLISSDPSPKAMVVNNHDLSKVLEETTIQRMERINKMIEETSELLKTSSSTF